MWWIPDCTLWSRSLQGMEGAWTQQISARKRTLFHNPTNVNFLDPPLSFASSSICGFSSYGWLVLLTLGMPSLLEDEVDVAQVTSAMCRKANYLLHTVSGCDIWLCSGRIDCKKIRFLEKSWGDCLDNAISEFFTVLRVQLIKYQNFFQNSYVSRA